MVQTIQVKYSCFKCGIFKQTVNVPIRGPENVVEWTNKTAAILSRDHDYRSPHCKITSLSQVWIPLDKNDNSRIGDPIKN